jgi:hypothetical protein
MSQYLAGIKKERTVGPVSVRVRNHRPTVHHDAGAADPFGVFASADEWPSTLDPPAVGTTFSDAHGLTGAGEKARFSIAEDLFAETFGRHEWNQAGGLPGHDVPSHIPVQTGEFLDDIDCVRRGKSQSAIAGWNQHAEYALSV